MHVLLVIILLYFQSCISSDFLSKDCESCSKEFLFNFPVNQPWNTAGRKTDHDSLSSPIFCSSEVNKQKIGGEDESLMDRRFQFLLGRQMIVRPERKWKGTVLGSQPSPVFSISYLEKVEREIMRILSSFRRDCMIARWRQEKDSRTIMKFLSARQKRLEKGGQKDRNFLVFIFAWHGVREGKAFMSLPPFPYACSGLEMMSAACETLAAVIIFCPLTSTAAREFGRLIG